MDDSAENREAMRRAVIEKAGEYVFYIREIATLLGNLGRPYHINTVRQYLKSHGINPSDLGVSPSGYYLEGRIRVYKQTDVWQFITSLAGQGKINLKKRGIESIDDLIARSYHRFHLERA